MSVSGVCLGLIDVCSVLWRLAVLLLLLLHVSAEEWPDFDV